MAEPVHPIPRSHLTSPGAGGLSPAALALRIAAVAFVLSLVVIGWAALAPLSAGGAAPTVVVASPNALAWPEQSTAAARGERIGTLTEAHVFSANRMPWGLADVEGSSVADAAPAPSPIVLATADETPQDKVVVHVDDLAEVEKQTRESFETIRLKAVCTAGDGARAAMIAFAHSKAPDQATLVKEGGAFNVPRKQQQGEDAWTLLRVDLQRDRVFVRRNSTTLAIALFPDDAVDAGAVTIAASDAPEQPSTAPSAALPVGKGVPRVERMEASAALEQIRKRAAELEAKDVITLDDLAELMALTTKQADEKVDERDDPGS